MNSEQVLSDDEQAFLAQYERIQMLLRSHRFDYAKELLAGLLASYPDRGVLWYAMAIAHNGSGEYAQARDAVGRALASSPDNAELYLLFSVVLINEGKVGEGVSYAERALAIEPDMAMAHLRIAWALSYVGRELDRALWHAQRAQELEPDAPECHHAVGVALLERGSRRAATRARPLLETAARGDPDDADIWNSLARTDLRRSKPVGAVRGLIAALRIDPHLEAASYNLPIAVWALIVRGRWWMFGLFLITLLWSGVAYSLRQEQFAAGITVHCLGGALVLGASWWVLVRRPLRVFPPSMRMAAKAVLRSDQLVRPSWLGLAWVALVQVVMVTVPWPDTGLLVACVWMGIIGFWVGLFRSRFRMRRMRQAMVRERANEWRNVVTSAGS